MSYEWDLDGQLGICLQQFEQSRERYWQERLDADEWSALNQLRRDADEIAAAIRKRALALQNVGDISELKSIHQAYLHERQAAEDRYAELEAMAKAKLPPELAESIGKAFRSMIENRHLTLKRKPTVPCT